MSIDEHQFTKGAMSCGKNPKVQSAVCFQEGRNDKTRTRRVGRGNLNWVVKLLILLVNVSCYISLECHLEYHEKLN